MTQAPDAAGAAGPAPSSGPAATVATGEGPGRASTRVEWANALRGIAALSVLVAHYAVSFFTAQEGAASLARRPPLYAGAEGAPWFARALQAMPIELAALGVGLFFLISGYVIAISLDRYSRRGFVVGRTLRILPTYAAGFLVTCAVVWAVSDPNGELTPWAVLAGMVPGLANVLGVAAPADGIVWTLIVEGVFYGVCLVAYRSLTRKWYAVVLAALACVALQLALPHLPWSSHVPVAGLIFVVVLACPFLPVMLIGVVLSAYRRGQMGRTTVIALVPVLTVVHTVLLARNPIVRVDGEYRLTFILTIAAFCVLSVAAGGWRAHPVTDFFADISYPLYVVHAVLGYVLLYALTAAGVRSPVAITATSAAAIATAWLLHLCVERPTHRFGARWARRLSVPRAPADPAAS